MSILAVLLLAISQPTSSLPTSEEPVKNADSSVVMSAFVNVSFVVVYSTPSYDSASAFANEAADRLEIPVDLRGLVFDRQHGLSWSRQECEGEPFAEFPCYFPRGRYDEGVYLSIEISDSYDSLEPGEFLVIAASGEPEEMEAALVSVREVIADAYIKTEKIYFGGMH